MKRPVIFTSIAVLAMVAVLPFRVFAASPNITLAPSATSVTAGDTVTVTISEDSGTEPVNAVQANLSYPANLLQYVSTGDNAKFDIDAQTSVSGGTVQIARGTLTPVTGAQAVATLTFKALASSGNAALSFTNGTAVVSANSNTVLSIDEQGASINISTETTSSSTSSTDQSSTDNSSSSTSSTQTSSHDTAQTSNTQPSTTTTSNSQPASQPVATLPNTGMGVTTLFGISGLVGVIGYAISLSYRKFAQR